MDKGHILKFSPYETLRSCQEDTLLKIEKEWFNFDVAVVRAPVGSGKSGIAVTLQAWLDGGCIITPNNLLRNQYIDDFPHMKTVKSQDEYWLDAYEMTEKEFRKKIYKYGPKDSEYEKDRKAVKRVGTPVVANYHTYMAHKLQRKLLIVDEAHQLLKTLQDIHSRKIWKHVYGYPERASTPADILEWIDNINNPPRAIAKLRNGIKSLSEGTVLEFGREYYRGSSEDCLKLIPLDVSMESPIFWPSKTKKIILMSATIGEEDVKAMGLSQRRVLYIDVESPIPEDRRPIKFVPIADMSRLLQPESIPEIADAILNIASQNPEKGMIHATYDIAQKLKPYLESNPRFMFHTNKTKKDIYDSFIEDETDKILVGSGMYEGINLKFDAAKWQVLTKCPYPSLMNPAYRFLAREQPERYLWHVTKDILQASGRICRDPEDYGITYLLDSAFEKWYNKARATLPNWFKIGELG